MCLQLLLKFIGKMQALPSSTNQEENDKISIDKNQNFKNQEEIEIICIKHYKELYNFLINKKIKPIIEMINSETTNQQMFYLNAYDLACQLLVAFHTHFRFNQPKVIILIK